MTPRERVAPCKTRHINDNKMKCKNQTKEDDSLALQQHGPPWLNSDGVGGSRRAWGEARERRWLHME